MDQLLPVPGVDPSSVATLADFAACLNGLRKRRDLSYEAMEAASREMMSRHGGDRWQLLSKSTVGEIVNGERLPSRDRLLTFLAVCGLTPADQVQWIAAWERVSALGAATSADLALPRHVIALIEDKTREFVGRDYVFDSITDFIDNNTSGYFVLEGDPGTGKSAVLAEYVKRHGCVAHFNQRAEGITDFRQFLESIFAQLRARYKLPHQSMPPDAVGDGAFLSQLLQEAASRLSGGQRLVIAVDALDEVDLAVSRSGANILYLPSILPDGVYFVMTKRHLDIPLTVAARRASYSLEQDREGTVRDVSVYIRSAIQREGLEQWLSARGISDDNFVATLVDRSEGNFMYLRYVLPEIGSGVYDDLEIGVLPKGLQGYYDDHWRRMGMVARPLPRLRIRIIYILAEVKQPVSRRLIAQFATDHSLTVDELTVQEVLDDWLQFLHVQRRDDSRFSLYHASFRDFLHRKDVVQAAGVAVKDINAMIADDLWGSLFGDPG